jgi:hypothetical protein
MYTTALPLGTNPCEFSERLRFFFAFDFKSFLSSQASFSIARQEIFRKTGKNKTKIYGGAVLLIHTMPAFGLLS